MTNIKKFLSDPELWDQPEKFKPERWNFELKIRFPPRKKGSWTMRGSSSDRTTLSPWATESECAWENPLSKLNSSSSLLLSSRRSGDPHMLLCSQLEKSQVLGGCGEGTEPWELLHWNHSSARQLLSSNSCQDLNDWYAFYCLTNCLANGLVRSSSVYKISERHFKVQASGQLGRGYWGLTYAIHRYWVSTTDTMI